ncbi:hypothetical protein CRYUN_Cryun28dG0089700 [Craigia yunnanensis]
MSSSHQMGKTPYHSLPAADSAASLPPEQTPKRSTPSRTYQGSRYKQSTAAHLLIPDPFPQPSTSLAPCALLAPKGMCGCCHPYAKHI